MSKQNNPDRNTMISDIKGAFAKYSHLDREICAISCLAIDYNTTKLDMFQIQKLLAENIEAKSDNELISVYKHFVKYMQEYRTKLRKHQLEAKELIQSNTLAMLEMEGYLNSKDSVLLPSLENILRDWVKSLKVEQQKGITGKSLVNTASILKAE